MAALVLLLTGLTLPLNTAMAQSSSLLRMRSPDVSLRAPQGAALAHDPWREFGQGRNQLDRRARVAPLGLEVAGAVLGAGLAAAGATMVSVDGQCADRVLVVPENEMRCISTFSTRSAGVASLTAGLLVFGGAMLTLILDARRGRSRAAR